MIVAPARIYLQIPFADKDRAKELARSAGTSIRFDGDRKKWYWEGESLPEALKEFPVVAAPALPKPRPVETPKSHTDEQMVCIETEPAGDETIRWLAFAGSGKTTTLCAFTHARPQKRFLYLAFNKAVADEGKGRFNRNTDCMTIHALAYRWLPQEQKARVTEDIKANTLCEALNRNFDKKEDRHHASVVRETLIAFLSSAGIKVPCEDNLPKDFPDELDKQIVLRDTMKVWTRIQDPQEPLLKITHDAYLKMYALALPKLPYDYILLDEAQDTNPVTEEIVLNQPIGKILVGDSAQGIYSFRRAENSLDKITSHPSYKGRTLYLTKSFRFGSHIALLANNILHHFKGETNRLQGLGKDGGKLYGSEARPWLISEDLKDPVKDRDFTLVTRSNSVLFQEAYDAVKEIEDWENAHDGAEVPRLTIGFVGTKEAQKYSPLQSYKFGIILDAFNLYVGNTDRIYSSYIKSFPNFDALKDAGANDQSPDQEIAGPVNLVVRFGKKIPGMVKTILDRSGDPSSPLCWVRLTTAHKAKGLEWPRVKLTDDYAALVLEEGKKQYPAKPHLNRYPRLATLDDYPADEFHLIYMAVTRARRDLLVNAGLESFIQFLSRK